MRKSLIASILALTSIVGGCEPSGPATTTDPATSAGGTVSASALSAVKEKVAGVASPTASAVTIVWNANQFSVTIENSELNNSTHSARNSEATTIADTIVATIANMPEFAGLVGVHIDYVSRESGDGKLSVVDSIDFRKDSTGLMKLHTT